MTIDCRAGGSAPGSIAYGSLCSGIGGLDLAVEHHFGARPAWHAEIDPGASAVLAARWLGVPNLGDFRGQNPPAVDILCAGFPCQPVSQAGRRRGTNDERWIWEDILELLGRMEPRPRVCVFENVAGLLTANGGDAMGRVVQGLARLGYVGRYGLLRASDVGAPHRRTRIFIVARLVVADPVGVAAQRRRDSRDMAGPLGEARRQDDGRDPSGDAVGDSSATAAHADHVGCEGLEAGHGPHRRVDIEHRDDPARRGEADADADEPGLEGPQPTQRRHLSAGSDGVVADPVGGRLDSGRGLVEGGTGGVGRGRPADHDCPVDFGPYAPAVERWEHILGRRAPEPVDANRRLNPVFVEFLMGFPEGWCTGVLSSRTQMLRALGNAVVPQQAAAALALLDG